MSRSMDKIDTPAFIVDEAVALRNIILITFNIVVEQQRNRLLNLHRRIEKLTVTADSSEVVKGLSPQTVGLSEEHGTVLVNENSPLKVGDQINIIPNHVCVVSNMFDSVLIKKTTGEIKPLPIDARGCVH